MKIFKIFVTGLVVSHLCQAAEVARPQTELDKELFFAIDMREEAEIRALLVSKANPNVCDDKGETPLMKAVRSSYGVVHILIDYGANPYAVDSQGHDMDHFIEEGECVFGGHGARAEILRKSIMRKMKTDGHIKLFLPDVLEDIVIEYCTGSMYWKKEHDYAINWIKRMVAEKKNFEISSFVDHLIVGPSLNLDARKQADTPSVREEIEAAVKKYKTDLGKHPREDFLSHWQKLEKHMEQALRKKKIFEE